MSKLMFNIINYLLAILLAGGAFWFLKDSLYDSYDYFWLAVLIILALSILIYPKSKKAMLAKIIIPWVLLVFSFLTTLILTSTNSSEGSGWAFVILGGATVVVTVYSIIIFILHKIASKIL